MMVLFYVMRKGQKDRDKDREVTEDSEGNVEVEKGEEEPPKAEELSQSEVEGISEPPMALEDTGPDSDDTSSTQTPEAKPIEEDTITEDPTGKSD